MTLEHQEVILEESQSAGRLGVLTVDCGHRPDTSADATSLGNAASARRPRAEGRTRLVCRCLLCPVPESIGRCGQDVLSAQDKMQDTRVPHPRALTQEWSRTQSEQSPVQTLIIIIIIIIIIILKYSFY